MPDRKKVRKRTPELDKGKIRLGEDFDEPLPAEVVDEFYK